MFGTGSPMPQLLPSEGLRRLITSFLFGTTGALIALSSVGKESGAHINPGVTVGFWLMGKMKSRVAAGYILAQLSGGNRGLAAASRLGLDGPERGFRRYFTGARVYDGAVLAGEIICTFAMITLLSIFLGFRNIRPFTPALFPPLYSLMVFAEAPISGTSTNPARSLGPAVISGAWQGWWIYWAGPLIGMFLGILACGFLAKRIEVAKLYHFESDNRRIFHTGA